MRLQCVTKLGNKAKTDMTLQAAKDKAMALDMEDLD